MGRQAQGLTDPVASVNGDFDKLSKSDCGDSPASRKKINARVNGDSLDSVWSADKNKALKLLKDAKLARDLKGVFDSDLHKKLSEWKSLSGVDGDLKKATGKAREISEVLLKYDARIAEIYDKYEKMDLADVGYVSLLRTMIRSVAGRLGKDLQRLADVSPGPP
jgi:hypothetical protein